MRRVIRVVDRTGTDFSRTGAARRLFAGVVATAGAMDCPAHAADEDFRIWENVTTIAKLGSIDPSLDKWRLWMESQGRFRDDARTADQALGRGGIGYALSDRMSVWLGYACRHLPRRRQDAT